MSMSLTGAAAAFSAVMAGSTIWLLLTEPATVARAMTNGVVTPLVRTVADLLIETVRRLLTYL
jgi:hypothetical protein